MKEKEKRRGRRMKGDEEICRKRWKEKEGEENEIW